MTPAYSTHFPILYTKQQFRSGHASSKVLCRLSRYHVGTSPAEAGKGVAQNVARIDQSPTVHVSTTRAPSRALVMSNSREEATVTAVVVKAGRGRQDQSTRSGQRWGGRRIPDVVRRRRPVSAASDVLGIADRHLFALISRQFYRLSEFGGYEATVSALLQQRVYRLNLVPTLFRSDFRKVRRDSLVSSFVLELDSNAMTPNLPVQVVLRFFELNEN